MDDEPKVYLTVTTKPLAVASREHLPAVQTSVKLDDLENAKLASLVSEAIKRLEAPDAAA